MTPAAAAAAGPPLGVLLALIGLCMGRGVGLAEAACGVAGGFAAAAWVARRAAFGRLTGPRVVAAGVGATLVAVAVLAEVWAAAAVAWAGFSAAWVGGFLNEDDRRALRPWWPAAAMLVPWVWADGQWLGWQMRMTGAAAAEQTLSACFGGVDREGTTVLLGAVRLDVSAACAGLTTLQVLLAAGLAAAAMRFGRLWLVLTSLPLVAAFAWAANVARIVGLGVLARTLGPDYATGSAHDLLGWGVVAAAGFACVQLMPRPKAVL